ncbi:MAG: glycosyltransferase family 4 protein [Caldiserica bacterium]|nr:glycosyltransferase family 4 protein [Caldisericota bacterium]
MRRIKVLHVITRLILGGAQENTIYTVEGLKKFGYEVTLYTGPPLGPEGSLAGKAGELGIHPVTIPSLRRNPHPVLDYASFGTLLALFKKNKYHIVHTHSSKAGILGRWAAYFSKIPIIVHTIHGLPFFPYQHPFLNFLYLNSERITAPITDKIITVCEAMKFKALSAGVGKEHQYATVYSGMELDPFLSTVPSPQLREKLGIKEGEVVIGKIARLFPLKGHKFVVRIAPEVIKKFPRVKFLLVGDGILREKLMERIKELKLEDRFIFAGLVPPEKIPDYLALMDIVIHTSLREGLARVIPQAMAAGKPVVTWDLDGSGEIVQEGETGFLIPSQEEEKLKKAIFCLLENRELREKMGEKGKKLVDPLFRKEEMARRIHEVYQELLKEKGVVK